MTVQTPSQPLRPENRQGLVHNAGLQFYQPLLHSNTHRFSAIAGPQLGQDRTDVKLHRPLRDNQFGGDFLCDLIDHLPQRVPAIIQGTIAAITEIEFPIDILSTLVRMLSVR